MNKFYIGLALIVACLIQVPFAKAESEISCAIWLCLPGGFPTGCAAAYSEFKHRIKKGKSPLPSLSSCTTGPDGKSSNGKYELGIDYFIPCKEGFAIEEHILNSSERVICKPTNSLCSRPERYWRRQKIDCISYDTTRRVNPRYVKMWVDGQYLGQFFYQ